MIASRLRQAFKELAARAKQQEQVVVPLIENARLPKISESMNFDRLQIKPITDKRILDKWHCLLEKSNLDALSAREIKGLCWEPLAASSPEFLLEIKNRKMSLGRSQYKGLVYSVLDLWNIRYSLKHIHIRKLQ